jgi:hypothetical protein
MVDGLDDDDLALKSSRRASVLPGLVVIILGLLALAIAAVEYLVNAGIANSAGHDDGWLGLSFGTAAYIAGYAGAGVVLVVLGIWKIYRAGIES